MGYAQSITAHRRKLGGVAAIFVGFALAVLAHRAPARWRDEVVAAQRGTIRDREGRVVATDSARGRHYPYGHLGAHAIGDVGVLTSRTVGRSGLEAAWDGALHGAPGLRRASLDATGAVIDDAELRPPTAGLDVWVTLDMELMRVVEDAFPVDAAGAVVIVDVRDGDVLALFSAPSFEPNELSVLAPERLDELRSTDALVDRAVGRAMPPGGTFKTLTVLAGLEEDIRAEERIECDGAIEVPGRRHAHCRQPHGHVDARAALETSCDAYVYTVALRFGLGPLARVASDFGLGAPTGIGLRFEAAGHVPSADTDPPFEAMWTAAGQHAIQVTPLQLAMAYAAIANGGTLWTPRLVSATRVADGTLVESLPTHARRRVAATAEHLAFLRDALAATAAETLEGARPPPIAGKTGHGRGDDDWFPIATWFAGFAPIEDPEIAIVVLMDGGYASEPAVVAAEIYRRARDRPR
jgi:penicillin-binding protein 2